MDKEYRANQRKQKKTFKKFRKYIGRIFLWAGVGIASAAFFPGAAVMGALKGVVGDLLATSVAFFSQWGIAGVGFIGAMVNAFKAHHAAKTIDDLQDEEENTVDGICRDKDNAEKELTAVKNKEAKEIERTKDDNTSVTKVVKIGREFTVYKNNGLVQENEKKEEQTQETGEEKQYTKAS